MEMSVKSYLKNQPITMERQLKSQIYQKSLKTKEQIKTLKEFCDEQNGCENCKLGDYSFSDEDCKKLYSIVCKNKGKITITIDISKEI